MKMQSKRADNYMHDENVKSESLPTTVTLIMQNMIINSTMTIPDEHNGVTANGRLIKKTSENKIN